VAVVSPDGKAEIRAIKIGPTFGQMIVVTDGLKAGEKVIVRDFRKSDKAHRFWPTLYRFNEGPGSARRFKEESSAGQS